VNRSVSFSISFVGHTACLGLLLLTCNPAKEAQIIKGYPRVTLIAPEGLVPPSKAPETEAPARPTPRRRVEAPRVKRPKDTFNPKMVTRTFTRRKAAPPVEYTDDIAPIPKLKKEWTPARRRKSPQTSGARNISVAAGSSASYDAIIAGYIKSNWMRPSRAVVGNNPRPVSVAIRIAMDGKITRTRVVKSSRISVLDASALQSIKKSNPLPVGLPSYMARRYYDVTIVFCVTDDV